MDKKSIYRFEKKKKTKLTYKYKTFVVQILYLRTKICTWLWYTLKTRENTDGDGISPSLKLRLRPAFDLTPSLNAVDSTSWFDFTFHLANARSTKLQLRQVTSTMLDRTLLDCCSTRTERKWRWYFTRRVVKRVATTARPCTKGLSRNVANKNEKRRDHYASVVTWTNRM